MNLTSKLHLIPSSLNSPDVIGKPLYVIMSQIRAMEYSWQITISMTAFYLLFI